MACIRECKVVNLSLARARKLVPEEYSKAYDWFIDMEGKKISQLPMGNGRPAGFDYPLARQAGIYEIGSVHLKSTHWKKCGYALSIHSERQERYEDKDVHYHNDGTWELDYKAQKGEGDQSQGYNASLMKCLEDGVPVGVMIKSKRGGYNVHGLAYVMRYNPDTSSFILRGPAR